VKLRESDLPHWMREQTASHDDVDGMADEPLDVSSDDVAKSTDVNIE